MLIVSRADWKAVPPKRTPVKIALPTPRLWLHHSAGAGSDEVRVKAIQTFHMAPPPIGRGWNDIAYSYLIDNDPPDVDVFEGRGAGIAGGHTQGDNTQSHGLCVIGDFRLSPPADETLQKIAELVAHGHKQGWWPLAFTGGHRDAPGAATTCPGDALWELIPEINAEAKRIHNGDDMAIPADKMTEGDVNAAIDWNKAFGAMTQARQQALMAKLVLIADNYPVDPAPGDGLEPGTKFSATVT